MFHFVPYYPPDRVGGVGEFVAELHRQLLASGHNSTVVTVGTTPADGVLRIARTPLGWFAKTATWAWRLGTGDIVHCQAGEALPLLLMLALRRERPRVLTTFHGSYRNAADAYAPYRLEGHVFATGFRTRLYRRLIAPLHHVFDRIAAKLSDTMNTISHYSAQEMAFAGSHQRPEVIYYGLPSAPQTGSQSRDCASRIILYVGTGGHRKRALALPFVLSRVRRTVSNARLRIVGILPSEAPRLMSLIHKLDVADSVEFVGIKASQDIGPLYESADVLVVPSAYEGLPFVILEAMRNGLPVVATRVCGHPEAIRDGVDGFLVEVDQPQQLADRCVRLMRDEKLAERIGNNAREVVRSRFSSDQQYQRYLQVYADIER